MKQKHLYIPLLIAASLCGGAVRFWNLRAAVDSQGLPATGHPSTYALIGCSLFFLLLFLLLSFSSQGRSGAYEVLSDGPGGLSLVAAVLILLGAIVEFAEALLSGPSIGDPIMCLLGLLSGICLLVVAQARRRGLRRYPAPELIPIVYLVVKLILNFKNWSTDPIILDYCDILFALIFVLLAFYRSAGFFFDQGQPRKTLFFASAAILFSSMAAVDGALDGSISTTILYVGFLLWLWPVVLCLLVPRKAPEPPQTESDQNP